MASTKSLVTYTLATAGAVSLATHILHRIHNARKSSSSRGKKVALILSGCGVYDGSETTEVVSALIHLSRAGVEVSAFAPNKEQMHVVNHLTGEEEKSEKRNVLVEAARIARGNIKPLDECNADDFDALVIPGGFGAAKNLSDFASKGAEMSVDPTLEKIMVKFQTNGKPIGVCCIAPTIAAKVFGKKGCKLTVGSEDESEKYPFAGAAGAIKSLGAHHQKCEPHEACIDKDNKIVSSSAYMYQGQPHEIDDSVRAMIEGVLSLT